MPDPPESLKYILRISRWLSRGGELSYQEIESFCRLKGLSLTGSEIDILFQIRQVVHEVLYGE